MAKTKTPAKFVPCPGITNDGKRAHAMRDFCWSCAPFWETVPVCPTDSKKLTTTGYCRACKKHFDIGGAA